MSERHRDSSLHSTSFPPPRQTLLHTHTREDISPALIAHRGLCSSGLERWSCKPKVARSNRAGGMSVKFFFGFRDHTHTDEISHKLASLRVHSSPSLVRLGSTSLFEFARSSVVGAHASGRPRSVSRDDFPRSRRRDDDPRLDRFPSEDDRGSRVIRGRVRDVRCVPSLDRLRDEDVGVSRAPPIENWRRADRTDPPPRPRPAPLSTASQTPFPAEPRSTRTCRSPTKNGRRVRARRRSSRQPRTSRKFELLDSAVPRPGGSTRLPRRSPRSTLSIPTLQTQRPPSGTPRPTCRSASRRIRPTRSRTSDSVRVTPTPNARLSHPGPANPSHDPTHTIPTPSSQATSATVYSINLRR